MSITKTSLRPRPGWRGKRIIGSILPLVICILGLSLSGATIVNGQVCGDLAGTGKPDLADITLLIDHLFINHQPLVNAEVGNLDMCDSIDIADLALLIDLVYYSKNEACLPIWDCEPYKPHDVVRLTVARRPQIALGDSTLQIDLYVRNTVDLAGASMGFTWDSPKLVLDSFMATPTTDQIIIGGDDALRQIYFARFGLIELSYGMIDEYRLWASYYFSVENWIEDDSVRFDPAQWDAGSASKFVKIPYSDTTNVLGFAPRWDGPVIARDAGLYCDVNGSGKVDLADITQFIGYLFWGEPLDNPDLGECNGCDGTNIADLRYMINVAYFHAPEVASSDCDFNNEYDLVNISFSNPPPEETRRINSDQPLELQLHVRNAETVLDATMTFSWDNPNLVMDSAIATPVALAGFTESIVLYENDLLTLTNAGQLFNFKGWAGVSGPGIPGDSTELRLWATYYFTLANWMPGEEVMIDTMVFSDGSAFKIVNEAGEGHDPQWQWQPPYACCGVWTGGLSGNVDWNDNSPGTLCDAGGSRNLLDITRLIDYVYVTHDPLCCHSSGNVHFTYDIDTGLEDGKVNLSDITRLIDHVYVTKGETESCQ